MSLLAQIQSRPCLLEAVDGVIIAEPLRFISLKSIAANRRHSRIRAAAKVTADEYFRFHADLNTQIGEQHHVA